MKRADTNAQIRRDFFLAGKTIKQNVRDLHVWRNTVRKVVRSGAKVLEYERELILVDSSGARRERRHDVAIGGGISR